MYLLGIVVGCLALMALGAALFTLWMAAALGLSANAAEEEDGG